MYPYNILPLSSIICLTKCCICCISKPAEPRVWGMDFAIISSIERFAVFSLFRCSCARGRQANVMMEEMRRRRLANYTGGGVLLIIFIIHENSSIFIYPSSGHWFLNPVVSELAASLTLSVCGSDQSISSEWTGSSKNVVQPILFIRSLL